MSTLPENCHTKFFEDSDSYSDISLPNLNPFFGQIWVEKVELFSLPGSWSTEYFEEMICKDTKEGFEAKNNFIKCLLLLHFYGS